MRVCHRSGAQVNQHQPLVHALSRTPKRMSIRHQVESGAPFDAERDLRMEIVIEKGGLRDATAAEYRNKAILLDVTYADPQRWARCVQAALTETGLLLTNLKRASAATTLDRDKCPSTSAATNSPPSRWKALGASERKAAT